MGTATKYMQAAIDNSKQREKEECEKRGGKSICNYHASGVVETPIGRLAVFYVAAHGVSTRMNSHMRKGWKLNGKVISQAKLIKALEQV